MTVFVGGQQGFQNDTGTAAEFNSPNGIAIDSAGNLYIADSGNNCIRKVTLAGVVSTLAGGIQGNLDSSGTSAEFNTPYGVAVGPDGMVYVADTYNNCIRKIAPNGVTATFAGNGTAGYKDGAGAVSEFNLPFSLALDANGNLYVADAGNNRIRKISPLGDVSTVAGNGMAAHVDGDAMEASFSVPNDLVLDGDGNIFVADYGNNCIREVTFGGHVSTFAGSGVPGHQDGPAGASEFQSPTGISIDRLGNLFVADNGNNQIRRIKPDGETSTFAGSGTQGLAPGKASAAEFSGPADLATSPSGRLFVVDTGNNLVREVGS